MTVIILSRFGRDAFSLTGFYRARARRILPALTATCVAVPVVGWFMLLPEEYETLGTHVLASLTFLSNFVYWKEAGYFEAASHDKWLLHTWSLSVEWQFYLLYPLGLLALRRLRCAGGWSWWPHCRSPVRSTRRAAGRRRPSSSCLRALGNCWPAASSFCSRCKPACGLHDCSSTRGWR